MQKISVCVPTYHGTDYIGAALDSIVAQSYEDFEVVICNDSLDDEDKIRTVVDSYNDGRISLIQNQENLGYPGNIKKSVEKSHNEVVFLMAQDDVILDKDTFKKCIEIFNSDSDIGSITRPYYWFEDDVSTPIRHIPKISERIISADSDAKAIHQLLETVGQFSGLVFLRSKLEHEFDADVFTAHIYPFISVLRNSNCYYWEDYMIAVRTSSSQTRFLSSIYNPSPTKTWAEMFINLFPEDRYKSLRETGIEHAATNYMGLVQIKNYGYYKDLITDIKYMIHFRIKNLLNVKFWFFVLGTLLTPRFILRRLVDYYKNNVGKRKFSSILDE